MLLYCCLLLLCGTLWSQQPATYAFTHYRISDGLAANIVNNVVQDDRGFMWLSTINGLQRFDGNKFLTFKSDTTRPGSLPSDDITQVYKDRNGNLWVLTADNKVGIFNTAAFKYKEVPVTSWSNKSLYAQKTFVETADGKLLLYMNYTDRLFEFDSSAGAFVPSSCIHIPSRWKFNFLLQDKTTQKFYITTDSGFVVYNPKTGNASYVNHNVENEPLIKYNGAERFLNYQYLDAKRRLFFEQWPKSVVHPTLKVFDFNTLEKQEYNLGQQYQLGYHVISGILQQQNGKLWMCGLPFLAEYTSGPEPFRFVKKDYNKERDVKFNKAFSIYEDRQQNIWVCTDYGLYLFNPDAQLFQNYMSTNPKQNMVEGRAQAAAQLWNGEIWVGYRDLGLNCYDKNFNALPIPASIEPFQRMKSVWDIHQHSKTGNVWIALQGGQVVRYDKDSKRAQLLTPPAFERRAVTQIAEDKKGNLWFGTQGGNLVKWTYGKAGNDTSAAFELIARTGIINKLFADGKGGIWVAAFGEGLLKFDPQSNKLVRRISKDGPAGYNLWNNVPNDIIQYNDSLLLVASGALNLVHVTNGRVNHISTRDGLLSNTVSSVAQDARGVLWLGTLNGLCRADVIKRSFVVYNQNDGLQNEDFNVAGAFTLNDGRLLFTSVENFVVFNPLHAGRKTAADKAVITDFRVSNVPLRVDSLQSLKRASLAYDKNSVVFEFSALNYSKQNKLEYYYRLVGLDDAWIKSEERHQAVYNFLPPGPYRFEVKTKNIDGVFSPSVASLDILVNPPFWQTWWFYTLVLLLVVFVLYLLDRERMRRLATLHNVRSEIAGHLHMEVSTTLNNINVLSQIAKLKADKDIIRSKELIDEISDKSYNMVVNMDEILWSIDPDNDTMEKTLNRIFEQAQTLETNAGASIDIVVHEKVKDLKLDMKVRHDFFVMCREALQSLVEHSKNKSILVDIDLVRSKIVLKILSLEPETGNSSPHLVELKERLTKQAAAVHGSLHLDMGKKETSVVLSIPVK